MEALLDAADELAALGEDGQVRPDLAIPDEYAASASPPNELLALQDTTQKGKGWFAARSIPAGTLLMVNKPIAMVMDWEDDSEDAEEGDAMIDSSETHPEEKEPHLNEMLLIQILTKCKERPALWTDKLTTLFPRESEDLRTLPAWVCDDDAVFMQVESLIEELKQVPELKLLTAEISKRLPLIIRYNIFSVETCPELLSYLGEGGHSSLSGVGLYHLPSFFNHSPRPKCSRWAVGDVMAFVANQDIPAGQEVCISYIEHDVLCESAYRRNLMLRMDFDDGGEEPTSVVAGCNDEAGPSLPVVDSHVQMELMSMNVFERLDAIEELMQQATGEKLPQGEEPETVQTSEVGGDDAVAMETTGYAWFQCDVQNLRILKAIVLDSMGQTKEALKLWEDAVDFCETKLPPNDETAIVARVQAALCALHAGLEAKAKEHAAAALRIHAILFGGDVAWLRRRLQHDLQLSLRPFSMDARETAQSPVDRLWPLAP